MHRPQKLVAWGPVLSLFIQSCLASHPAPFTTAPAFVWGSKDYVRQKEGASGVEVKYEVLPATYLTDSIFGSLCSSDQKPSAALNVDSLASDSEDLVKLFIVGELRREDLAQQGSVSSVTPLKELVDAAPSALALPNVQFLDGQCLAAAVKAQEPTVVQLGSCDADTEAGGDLAQELTAALAANTAKLAVLACLKDGVTSAAVAELQKALMQAERPFLIVYIGQPDVQIASKRPPARTLLSSANQSQVLCTGKCIVQVRLFEIIILLSILLSAIFTGLCMMHILDVPSKFEVDKKESTSRHD
jgi:hypothetical protein